MNPELLRDAESLGASALVAASPEEASWLAGPRPLWPRARMAGVAHTVALPPGDNLGIHEAVAGLQHRAVLVADGSGLDVAVFGEILATAVLARGGSGVVIVGAVRDVEQLRSLGLAVFASAVSPVSPRREVPGRHHATLTVGSGHVSTGDLVVGDEDGVVAVSSKAVDRVLRRALGRRAAEREVLSSVRAGVPTLDALAAAKSPVRAVSADAEAAVDD